MRRFSVATSFVLLLGLATAAGVAPRLGDAHHHVAADEGTATPAATPSEGFALHVDAKMHFAGDHEALSHHYCKPVMGGMIECLLFDSDAADARLVGVEVIVDGATYDGFAPEEQPLWHNHTEELKKVEATLPDLTEEEAAAVVESLQGTYGKIYLLWDPTVDELPVGQPSVRIM
jgi:hypothetical protein